MARPMTEDETEAGVGAVYEHIKESFKAALYWEFQRDIEGADRVLATVDDAVTNNFDTLVAAFYGEEPDPT